MDWDAIKKRVVDSWRPKEEGKPLERIVYSFLSYEQRQAIALEERQRKMEEERVAYEAQLAEAKKNEPAPFSVYNTDFQTRYAHTHVLGSPGSGKTQLLQSMILADLERENRPTVVVVDSQGDIIHKLRNLDLPFEPLYINPRSPPSVNIFRVKNRGGDPEPSITAAIETLEYLFSGLGMDLSGKMKGLFKPMCRLMFSFDSTLSDVIDFLDKPAAYKKHIDALPELPRKFFQTKMLGSGGPYKTTKDDIGHRVEALIHSPTFQKLLTEKENTIDFYDELNKRQLILIDTDQAYLQGDDSKMFGRLFISLILRAALERARVREQYRTPAFLYVDEAQEYFDQKTEHLLTQARKYKLGVVLAHHFLNQTKGSLRDALMQCAIKLVSCPNFDDRTTMSKAMGTEYISRTPLTFTCATEGKINDVKVEYGLLESRPKRTHAPTASNIVYSVPGRSSASSKKISKGVDSYGEDA